MTKAQFAERIANASPPERRVTWGFAPHLEAGRNISPLWANPGESVRISLFVQNLLDSIDDHRIYATVLVNYSPVKATWVRWLEDRGGAREMWNQSGIAFDVAEIGELLDLEIPADTFVSAGVYEVAILVKMGRPHHKHFDLVKRISLYHGGFDWPETGCFEEPLVAELNEWEEVTGNNIHVTALKRGLNRVQGKRTVEEVNELVRAAPGEVVPVEVSMFNAFDRTVPAAAIPTLEGEPITDEPWLFFVTEDDTGPSTIASRRRFDVRMPDTPGVYDFFVPVWYFAMQPAVGPLEDESYLVADSMGGTTNTIRFVVE